MPWSDADLTAIAGGPDVSGSPVGYTTTDLGGQGPAARVVYMGPRDWEGIRHVHELSLVSGGNWSHTDITAIAGGPAPFGAAMGYATDLGSQGPAARVLYSSEDRHIHELSMVG